jgi:hypothetical protein
VRRRVGVTDAAWPAHRAHGPRTAPPHPRSASTPLRTPPHRGKPPRRKRGRRVPAKPCSRSISPNVRPGTKGDGPRYPQCARAVSRPQPPPLLTRRCMNAYTLTLGRNFLTAWRNAVTRSEHAACNRGTAGTPRNRGRMSHCANPKGTEECRRDARARERRRSPGLGEMAVAGRRECAPCGRSAHPLWGSPPRFYHSGCFVRERPEAGRVGGRIAASADQGPPTSLRAPFWRHVRDALAERHP